MIQGAQYPAQIRHAVQTFELLIEQIQSAQWKKSISKALKSYNIKVYNLEKITMHKVKEMYYVIVNKFYKEEKNTQNWHENQLRVFVWLLFAYSASLKKSADQFSDSEWQHLSNVFISKPLDLCQFQYHSLKKLSDKLNKWAKSQDNLLIEILGENELKNKWNDVAKKFYIESKKKYFRTPKQCRERWNNYLDPNKTKEGWMIDEDLALVQLVKQKGKKWATISKELLEGRRTQHMVKNRFNSLTVKYIKQNPTVTIETINLDDFVNWIKKRDGKSQRPRKRKTIVRNQQLQQPQSFESKKQSESIKQQSQQKSIKRPSPLIKVSPLVNNRIIERQQEIYRYQHQQHIHQQQQQHNLLYDTKSPVMLISPLHITNYTPMVFSPYTDYTGGFNLFSFDRLYEK